MPDKSTPTPWEHGVVKGDPVKFYLDALKSIIRTVEQAEADGRPVREWHTITIPGEEIIIANTGCGPSSAKNAALIVRAVNHHDGLVKVARRMWDAIAQEYDVDDGIANFSGDVTLAWEELGQVLAKVKEEGHG